MKKFTTLAGLLLLVLPGIAQQYQCLQPSTQVYFTNTDHYLRGMRIDSVQTAGTATIFHPYHSPRGRYLSGTALDTTGGSWLGKKVIQLQDGTTLFDNLWQDTVIIKTGTGLGSSWVFYDDTSTTYYTATVSALDTITIAGSVDSVKEMTIQAMVGSMVQVNDPVNGYTIRLSKNHGFVSIFDLYTFPYHEPGKSYQPGFDYFLDKSGDRRFTLLAFSNPKFRDIFTAFPGDVYQYRIDGGTWPQSTEVDTVLAKQLAGNDIIYTYKFRRTHLHPFPTNTFTYESGIDSTTVPDAVFLIVDTLTMPEEWGSRYFYYYDPTDTQYCLNSKAFSYHSNYIGTNGRVNTFEPCGTDNMYKAGIGLTGSYICYDPYPSYQNQVSTQLAYLNKNGTPCGQYNSLSAGPTIGPGHHVLLYPNPASDKLCISAAESGDLTVELYSTTGTLLCCRQSKQSEMILDVASLPAGLYFVRVITQTTKYSQKVNILH